MTDPHAEYPTPLARAIAEHDSLTQAKIVRALDVSRPTVSQWVSGVRNIPRRRAAQLAITFRIPMEELMSEEGRKA
jgi:transcriptional regulator with XRE-family HTH domain